jgi:6-phosphogluconolactonase
VSFKIETLPNEHWPRHAAARITRDLPAARTIVLTGGTTAEAIYRPLAEMDAGWSGAEVFFSDERCVPPDDDASNHKMASRTLLDHVRPAAVRRMKGELEPGAGAAEYSEEIAGAAGGGFDVVLLGMGADCHVGAMFPGSPALAQTEAFCAAVERPDGLAGLTLTPPALLPAKRVLLLVSGTKKAEALRRVVASREPVSDCPARLFADHPDVTIVCDEDASSLL